MILISHLGSYIVCPVSDWKSDKIYELYFSRLVQSRCGLRFVGPRLRRLPDDLLAGRPVLHVVDDPNERHVDAH